MVLFDGMCSVSSITRTFSRKHSHTSRSTAIKLVPLSLSPAKSDQCPVSATTGIVLTTNATKTKENMTRRWRSYREHHRGMVIDNSFSQPPLAVLPLTSLTWEIHNLLEVSMGLGKISNLFSVRESRANSSLKPPKFPASGENTAGARPRRRSGDQGVNPGGRGPMKKTEDQPHAPALSGS